MNAQVWVLGKKTFHPGSFMPGSIIRPKVNNQVFETRYNPGGHFQEPIGVSAHPFHNSMEAIEGIDTA